MSNLFRDARGVLERDGWRKGAGGVGQPTCLVGALARAQGIGNGQWWKAAATSQDDADTETVENKLLRRVIIELFSDEWYTGMTPVNIPWLWNDRRPTSEEDVLAVLDRAAEIADEEGLYA